MKVGLQFVFFETTSKSMQFLPKEMNETAFKGSGGKRCLHSKKSDARSNHLIGPNQTQIHRRDDCASIETRIESIGPSADFWWIFFCPPPRRRCGRREMNTRRFVRRWVIDWYAHSNLWFWVQVISLEQLVKPSKTGLTGNYTFSL